MASTRSRSCSSSRSQTTTPDARVDAYIAGLPDSQQAICQRVRALILAADPELEETIKRTVLPYFVCHGTVAALQATKHHVNVFLYDPLVSDPHGIITDGHDAATGRQIKVRREDTLDAEALTEMIREIVAHNRAGGWRKLKAARGVRSGEWRPRVAPGGVRPGCGGPRAG